MAVPSGVASAFNDRIAASGSAGLAARSDAFRPRSISQVANTTALG